MDVEKLLIESVELAEKQLTCSFHNANVLAEQILKIITEENEFYYKVKRILGLAKQGIGQKNEALEILKSIEDKFPNDIELLNNIGLCYSDLKQYSKCIEYLKKAIELTDEKSYLYSNLALQYRRQERYEEAIALFERAISIENKSFYWCMLGGCYGELLDIEKAKTCILKSIEIDPECASAKVDLAYCYQLQKQYELAWENYESRLSVFPQTKVWAKKYNPDKLWKGEDLTNSTIVIHSEQGSGDFIQFLRYLPKIKAKKKIIHCAEFLADIAKDFCDEVFTTPPEEIIDWAIMKNNKLPNHDYHASIISLPYLLKDYKVSGEAYVQIKEKSDLTQFLTPKKKVGIVWAGGPAHPNDRLRSCYLKYFNGLENDKIQLYSLQKDLRLRQYHDYDEPVDYLDGSNTNNIINLDNMLGSYKDTARILNSLDLLITVDTSIAHLAGAMGVKTWLLLPYNPDWRWGLNSERTEWYDSITIFRQDSRHNWESIFEKLKNKLN